jgi:hypothetical protein
VDLVDEQHVMLDEGVAADVPLLLRTALRSLDRAP